MKQPILIIIVCILASGFIFKVFTWPKIQEFEALRKNGTVLERNLKETREHFNKAEQYYEELQRNNKAALEKIDEALPNEIFVPELGNHYQSIANSAGMVLDSMNIGKPTVGIIPKDSVSPTAADFLKSISAYPVNAQTTGYYSSFKHLLFLLERSGKLIDITKVSFTASDKQNVTNKFTVETKTYSLK